ncbi:MAG: class I SAM-dependent methyltransferase [Okeania sp. SIO2C2]|uniref:class I SAM-dependent DNA methyltransferase n=1 Tax=Okeania sp. SIO2C2 TaxID=2607787 RepID=UPI0013BA15C0|nr:class I SAM-dependent methyltransferase [Okeania sp. SIO2C2]NEP86825.1 class I SAM-dependent methyltransferase [Okeania sp. SIO2C2]
MAIAVNSFIKNGHKKILELGVGTGLLAEKLKVLAPEAEFTGVDITSSMLDIARKRLGEWGKLIEADVYIMDLQETFDIAVSSRGVWVISQRGDRTDLGNHTNEIPQDIKGLTNVAKHLCQEGLLLLSVQGEHKSHQQNLPTGIVYSQEIEKIGENDEIESIEKSYFFKKDGEILAQQKLNLNYIKQWKKEEIMAQAGFSFVSIHESQKFHVYRKK